MTRRTVAAPLAGRGVGLFTGRPVSYAIRPAEAGSGVRFRRVDLPGAPEIGATVEHLSTRPVHPVFAGVGSRCTTLASGGDAEAAVAMVEHVLSALAGMGVTDALVEVDGPEMPGFDGSAGPYAILLRTMGLRDLEGPGEAGRLEGPLRVEAGEAWIVAEPADARCYRYELDYGVNPALAPQEAEWREGGEYAKEIAPARTFCLQHEAQQMRAAGLFTHLSTAEMLVLGPLGPIDNALRFENEPARHKLLDLIGDLSLVGRPFTARITAHRSGHTLNHEMARRLREALR